MDLVDLMRAAPARTAGRVAPARRAEPAPMAAPGPAGGPIRDAGEKIGGARKDYAAHALTGAEAAAMTSEEAAALVTKDAAWPKPDYAAAAAGGAEPLALALAKVIRDRLPARPTRGYRERGGVEAYVAMTGIVRDVLAACRTVADVGEAERAAMGAAGHAPGTAASPAARRLMLAVYAGRRSPLRVGRAELARAQAMVGAGFPGGAAPRAVRAGAAPGGPAMPARPHLDELRRVGPPRAHPGPLTSDRLMDAFGTRSIEYGNWMGDAERRAVVALAYDALMDLAEAVGMPPRAIGLGGTLSLAFGARGKSSAAAHYEPLRRVINVTRLSGAGHVAHEWAHALDHRLGTLGHPSPLEDGRPRYASGGRGCRGDRAAALPLLPPRVGEAVAEVMRRTRDAPDVPGGNRGARAPSSFLREAVRLCGPSGEYWRRPLEMFARAFEAMVHDSLRDGGRRNDYLVHGVEEGRFASGAYKGDPYPAGRERRGLNAALAGMLEAAGEDAGMAAGTAAAAA